MASIWSLTRTAPLLRIPTPHPEATAAALLALTIIEDVVIIGVESATGDATDHLHLLTPAVVPLLAPGLALTLGATDDLLAVAVITITDMAVDAEAVPHHAATGPTLGPTAAPLHLTDTLTADATGPALGPTPDLQMV